MKTIFYNAGMLLAILSGFIGALAVSIGFQSLVVWAGNLLPVGYNVGIALDVLVGALAIAPIFIGALVSDDVSSFTMGMFFAVLAIMGIYVSVTLYFNWFILVGCIGVFVASVIKMHRAGATKIWLYLILGAYLCYCIGTYYALILNGIEPAINMDGVNVLMLLLGVIWFKPFISYMSQPCLQ